MNISITLPDNQTQTNVKNLLEEWLVPRKVRHLLRTRKNVMINDETALFHETVKAKDVITLTFETSDYNWPKLNLGQKELISVLYEDEHLIIVEKPVGMKTHPNQPDEVDTLANHLAAYLEPSGQLPFIVHRLDKETSGLILFAKNPLVLPILGQMLEKKEIKRSYLAMINGQFTPPQQTFNGKIGRDRHDRRKRIVDARNGQTATTQVKLRHFDTSKRLSLLECQLETGRTHQIRVHLAHKGQPIVGDPLYQSSPLTQERMLLHAFKLSLVHPFTKETLTVESQAPFA